ncbi:hypothetical protein EVAR_92067_1 [Eumeta japonica]|uniref:Uncharacterized protein n=1 Tax=Eumeta variegata TaxID=151549 RepID=A0A4C1SY90_EUMVA|nr:hypothetical protein EVAR_92067_1 [Eumeta japonica]
MDARKTREVISESSDFYKGIGYLKEEGVDHRNSHMLEYNSISCRLTSVSYESLVSHRLKMLNLKPSTLAQRRPLTIIVTNAVTTSRHDT